MNVRSPVQLDFEPKVNALLVLVLGVGTDQLLGGVKSSNGWPIAMVCSLHLPEQDLQASRLETVVGADEAQGFMKRLAGVCVPTY